MTGLLCATLGLLFAYLPCSCNADLCHSVRPALGHSLQSDSVATNHYLCGFCFRCVFHLDKIIFSDGYIVLDLLWSEYEKYKCSMDFVLVSLSRYDNILSLINCVELYVVVDMKNVIIGVDFASAFPLDKFCWT